MHIGASIISQDLPNLSCLLIKACRATASPVILFKKRNETVKVLCNSHTIFFSQREVNIYASLYCPTVVAFNPFTSRISRVTGVKPQVQSKSLLVLMKNIYL